MRKIQICLEPKLQELHITRYRLAKDTGLSFQTINKYYNNQIARYEVATILKICTVLNCEPGDIIKIVDVEE